MTGAQLTPVQGNPFTYGPGSAQTGQPATPDQQAYAAANASFRNPNAPAGSATNPSYDTADLTGAPGTYHVPLAGGMSGPAEINLSAVHGNPFAGEPAMPWGEDVARTIPGAAARSVTSLAGLPGDLDNLGQNGFNSVADRVLGWAQDATGNDFGLPHHPHSPTVDRAREDFIPTSANLNDAVQGVTGAYHQPQSWQARTADTAVQLAPMAFGGEAGAGARLARVLMPTTTSSIAGEAFHGSKYEGLARLAGAVGGSGVQAGLERIVRAPTTSFGAAAGELSDAQIQQAQALRQSAAARGLNLTVPEAVQQVTNNGTGLGRLQRVVESTKQGQAATAPFFANRSDQVGNATRALADAIAPATDQPSMIGRNAQQAAQGSLDQVRVAINDLAKPHYEAMAGQLVPVASALGKPVSRYMAAEGTTLPFDRYQQLAGNAAYGQALDEVRGDRLLNAGIAHLPDHDVSVVNEVVKQLDRNAEAARQTVMNPSGNNARAGLFQSARNQADALATEFSPQWRAARDTVSGGRSVLLDPLESGPLGKIAATDAIPAQTAALYPGRPVEGAPAETSAAVRVLGNTAPGVAEDLTRQHIVNHLNESLSQLQGGQNQYAGAKLAAALAGNPEQAATLNAGLSALPGGAQHAANMDDLLEALRATGKRQQPGSMTAFNESDLKDLHIAPYAQAIGRIGDPLTWGAGIGDILNQANYRRNVSRLAEMIMASPETTADVLNAARGARMRSTNPMLPSLLNASDAGNSR